MCGCPQGRDPTPLLNPYRAAEQDLRTACDKIHRLKVSMAELTAKSAADALRHSTTSALPNHQQTRPAPQAHPGQGSAGTSTTNAISAHTSVTGTTAELSAKLAELQDACSQWERVGMMVSKQVSAGGSSGTASWKDAQAAVEQQLSELSELRRAMRSKDEQLITARTLSGAAEQQMTVLQQKLDETRAELEKSLLCEAVVSRKLAAVEQV